MRLARFLLLGSLLCTLVIFAARPQLPFAALANQETYATGYGVGQPFAAFFRAHGGVAIFGMPLGPVVDQQGGSVQYFERQRLEYHPEAAGSGREVQVGLLGYEVTEGRDFPAVEPFDDTDDARFYRVTGHSLRGQFLHYWQAYGGLPIFGYPISELLRERSADDGREYTVQYFERARLELHPELAGSPHEVLLGRLGATLWERQAAGRGRLAADAAVSPATSPMFTVSTSVSPTTAKQGGTVSINIAVSNGSGKQMSATAALAVVDPLGNQAYTKTWAKQS
ncbi:MAG: hypothetical protein ACJ8DJ_10100, partial [Gemmatimonadales bacterium]